MADYYLIPDIISKRAVKATGGGALNIPDFTALMLYFNRPSTDFSNGDHIYPSYDGEHEGLLEGYEFTLLAANDVCPIGMNIPPGQPVEPPENYPVIVGDISGDYVKIENQTDVYTKDLWFYDKNIVQKSLTYRSTFYATIGVVIAVFSDGKAYFATNHLGYDPEHPAAVYTYVAPTTQTYGYMLVSVNPERGRAALVTEGITINQNNEAMGKVLYDNTYTFSEDPYDNFPEPDDFGGDGDPDAMGPGDSIDIPTTPAISAADSGFVNLYNPSLAQLKALANYMWSGPFDLNSFKKIFADPMDCIIGLSIIPVAVPNGGVVTLTVGNISTGIAISLAAANFVEVDCGSLTVKRTFNSYMDYAPYTQVSIYLPYIGFRPLDADNIIPKGGETSKSIQVVYKVDLFTGACIAFIKCGGSVLYTFCGQCGVQIPVTGTSWTQLYRSITNFVCTAGTNFGAAAGGNMAAGVGGASSALDVAFSGKPQIQRSGALGSAIGMLGVQKPYLVIRRPVPCIPSMDGEQGTKYMQGDFTGYPSWKLVNMSDLSGYVEIDKIHLENIPATENELEEIESLLKGGVLI